MTNFEKYSKDMDTTSFAVVDGKPVSCNPDTPCYKCEFSSIDSDDNFSCYGIKIGGMRMEWLKAEYEEPKKINIPVNTPIDTKVLVSETGAKWYRRYYAGYENGNYYVWANGANSWSVNKEDKGHKTSWKYIKFAEEE